jgi:GNAT superfamily N-acetyltransferase
MKLLLREYIPTDAAAIAALTRAPSVSAEPSAEPGQRWIAKCEGHVVAFGEYQPEDAAQFWLRLAVHPAYQRRGIGSALYAHLLNTLRPLHPTALWAAVEAHDLAAERFLTARGFQPEAQSVRWVKLITDTGPLNWNRPTPSLATAALL